MVAPRASCAPRPADDEIAVIGTISRFQGFTRTRDGLQEIGQAAEFFSPHNLSFVSKHGE